MQVRKELKIEGLKSETDKANLMSALLSISEVESVDVILEKGIVVLLLERDISDDEIENKIEKLGYTLVSIFEVEV